MRAGRDKITQAEREKRGETRNRPTKHTQPGKASEEKQNDFEKQWDVLASQMFGFHQCSPVKAMPAWNQTFEWNLFYQSAVGEWPQAAS